MLKTGKRSGAKRPGVARLEPAEHLAFGDRAAGEERGELVDPGAGREDELAGAVGGALGVDAHTVACGLPGEDALAGVDLGAGGLGEFGVRDDREFGGDEAAFGLQHRERAGWQSVAWEALRQRPRVEHFVGEIVFGAGGERAFHDAAVGRAGVDRAGHIEQLLAEHTLRLAPVLVGAAQQGT